MAPGNIEKPTISYKLILLFAYCYFRLFYKRFRIIGKVDFPAGKPLIFAANHQDAMMDAAALLFSTRKQLVFLSRADLFKRKFIAAILGKFKMIPVFRPRDGIVNMGQNEETFRDASRVLIARRYLALFPEGNHAPYKRLRPLMKGLFRIAFMAEEKSGFTLGLQIVPVGLDYSNYYQAGGNLLVNFGDPIPVADFKEVYLQNPARAINLFKSELANRLKKLMIHIDSIEFYEPILQSAQMYCNEVLGLRKLNNNPVNRFLVQKESAQILDTSLPGSADEMSVLAEKMANYEDAIQQVGIRDWVVEKAPSNKMRLLFEIILMILLLPLHIYGFILNYLAYRIPVYFSAKNEDKVFHRSLNFGISLLFYPIYYLIIMMVVYYFHKEFFLNFIIFLSLPISGIFAFYYYRAFLKIRGEIRFAMLNWNDRELYHSIRSQRLAITDQISRIISMNHH